MTQKYTPTTWIGGKTIGTADVMNNIEQGIVGAYDELKQINSQLESVESNNNDFVLYSFFEKNESPTRINFFISTDGYNLKKINDKPFLDARDPSIIYKDGYWLIVCTSYNPHDFKIYKSSDFVSWESFKINCGMYDGSNKIWAPEWFKDDNGDLYIVVSKMVGSENDIDDNLIPSFRPYIIKCIDIENLTFDIPQPLELESSNKIDGHIIKHNGIYNLFIKDECDKYIEHWVSNDLTSWTKKKDKVDEFGQYVEGTFVVKYNNKFYAYNDKFKGDNGFIYCCESNDLITWSDKRLVNSEGERLRHGYAFNVKDNKAKNDLLKFMSFNTKVVKKNMRDNIINLSNFVDSNNEIHNLELVDKAVYRINNGQEYTLKSVINTNQVSEFYFYLSTNNVCSIKFDTDNSVISVPNGYSYSASFGDNDTLIKFVYNETLGVFKPLTTSNTFFYDKMCLKNDGWKRVTLTTGTYNPLNVENGVVYSVSGGNDVIINSVSQASNGTNFYLMLSSNSTGSITINNGSNIIVPGGKYVISKENNNNDCLIEFLKIHNSSFRLKK